MTTSPSELDRLSILWEAERHRLSPELCVFLCRAVMYAVEKWQGVEPPTPRNVWLDRKEPPDEDDWYVN